MGFWYVLNRELERRCLRLAGQDNVNYRGPLIPLGLLIIVCVGGWSTVQLCMGAWLIYLTFSAATLGAGAMAGEDTSTDRLPARPLAFLLIKWLCAALPLCMEVLGTLLLLSVLRRPFHVSEHAFHLFGLYAEGLVLWYAFAGVYWSVAAGSLARALVATYASVGALLLLGPVVLQNVTADNLVGDVLLLALATVHPLGLLLSTHLTAPLAPAAWAVLLIVPAAMAADAWGRLGPWLVVCESRACPPSSLTPTGFRPLFLLRSACEPLLRFLKFAAPWPCFGISAVLVALLVAWFKAVH